MKPFIKFFDKIIVVLLGIAGVFTGCKPESDCDCIYDSGIHLMYGPPPANYIIKGTVTNKANSKPVSNIRISRQTDTLYTDAKGNYTYASYYYSSDGNPVHLKFEDIDGEANGGHFATKEIDVKITNSDKEQMEKCYQNGGKFVKTQNIKLEKKK